MKKNSKSNTYLENSKSNTTYSQYKYIQKIYTYKKHNILTIQTHPENSKSNTNPKNSKSTTTYSQYKHTKKFQNQTQRAPKYKNTNP